MTKPPLLSGKKMKNLLISLTLFLVLFMMAGCSSKLKYVELDKETFSNLDASRVIEVDAVCIDRFSSGHPDEWIRVYPYFYPIRDSNRINTIINCIKKANFDSEYNGRKILLIEVEEVSLDTRKAPEDPVMHKNIFKNIYSIHDPNLIKEIETYIRKESSVPMVMIDAKIPFFRMLFKTNEDIYFIRILWDEESFYGDWWESTDLLLQFKKWGIERPKGESNLPPSREVYPHPPMDAK